MLNKYLVFVLVIGDLMAEGDPSVTSEIPTVQTEVQSVTTSHNDCGSLLSNVSLAGRLAVSVWEVYSDSVQLDWYITLQQKFRMDKCQVCYGSGDAETGRKIIRDFLPEHRTFEISGLERNCSYHLLMMCRDMYGETFASQLINFTTESLDVRLPKYSHIIQDSRAKGSESRNARPTVTKRQTVSPHSVLGLGCGVLLLVIGSVTSVIIFVNYQKYKQELRQSQPPSQAMSPAYGDCEQMMTISLYCSEAGEGSVPGYSLEMGAVQPQTESNNNLIEI